VKAFLEYVRLKTFGRNGYQQMQVDIFFLQTAMQTYAKSSDSIITSLSDVLVNVGERCLEPLQLEHDVFCCCKLK